MFLRDALFSAQALAAVGDFLLGIGTLLLLVQAVGGPIGPVPLRRTVAANYVREMIKP
jgi:hypothetical protein